MRGDDCPRSSSRTAGRAAEPAFAGAERRRWLRAGVAESRQSSCTSSYSRALPFVEIVVTKIPELPRTLKGEHPPVKADSGAGQLELDHASVVGVAVTHHFGVACALFGCVEDLAAHRLV